MKTILLSFLTLLISIFFSGQLKAQWEVGNPVNMELSTLTLHSLDPCYPEFTHSFWFPISEADGVLHIAIVDSLDSPDAVEIVSGNTISLGDTIHIDDTSVKNVYFHASSGVFVLKFYAIGTPTTSEDPIPCGSNDLWSSNLPICGIAHNPAFNIDGSCTVDEVNGLNDFQDNGVQVGYPTASNGYQLTVISDNAISSLQILDMSGRSVKRTNSLAVECGNLKHGLYILQVVVENERISKRFLLSD